jgi:hypothetical protein
MADDARKIDPTWESPAVEPRVARGGVRRVGPDDPLGRARKRGALAKRDLWAAQGEMLTVNQAAERLDSPVALVHMERELGRVLALPDETGELAFPAWQFGLTGGLLPGLEDILRDLGVRDPWMRAAFFTSGDVRLGGRMPLAVLLSGDVEAVRRAGAAYGEQLAS